MQWRFAKTSKMIIIGFLAGLLSTLVGIGGGPLFNPMLISIGLHP